ncbi:MAG TPA: VOC family protein [Candidatus Binataceae bacterium]|nr:VOC family protein [Candidatus Binataceae bacterium]
MELAKQGVDVGLFTNNLEGMQDFYGQKLGLQFESVMPVGGGIKQYRYLANGSVIKLMHTTEPLPRRHPGGYETIMIASPKVKVTQTLADPDDNAILLVAPGADDVTQIEVRIGVIDLNAYETFYTKALGATPIGADRYRVGDTIFGLYHERGMHKVSVPPFADALSLIKAMAAPGIRYVTLGVKDCDATFRALTAAGASPALAPVNFGTVARISFVQDPDGNFIEIAQRPAPAA